MDGMTPKHPNEMTQKERLYWLCIAQTHHEYELMELLLHTYLVEKLRDMETAKEIERNRRNCQIHTELTGNAGLYGGA